MAGQARRGHAWNDAFLTLNVRNDAFQALTGRTGADLALYHQLDTLGLAARYLVTRGYVVAVCNARGSGDSPGYLDPFSAQEQRDNYDLIEQNIAPDTLVTYAQHPTYDDFWRERSVKSRWCDLDVPTLEIAGWYDRYRDGMVANYQARTKNVWLVAGPWQHGMPAGQYADIGTGAYLAWWDHWLLGRRAPLPAKKITSFETPHGGWRQYDDWPATGAHSRTLALTTNGGLVPGSARPISAPFTVNTEPAPGTPDERIVFRTDQLRDDLVLAGGLEARVRATFPADDGNLAVVVSDVAPDGTATRITQGWLKASHRFSHDRPVPVRPGVAHDLPVHIWPTHYRVESGHRLEVTVSSDDYPEIDSDAPPGRVTVTRGTIEITTLRG